MRASGYAGPKTIWTKQLAAAKVDYRAQSFPGCEAKVKKSMDMDWNYLKPTAGRMARLADVFLKVEENLPALRAWEAAQDKVGASTTTAKKPKIRPSRREVLA